CHRACDCPRLLTVNSVVPSPPSVLSSTLGRPPRSTPFPYTTLFRSRSAAVSLSSSARCASRSSRAVSSSARRRCPRPLRSRQGRSEEHTSELQSPCKLVCRHLLEKTKKIQT